MLSTALCNLARPLGMSLRATWFAMVGGTLVYAFLAWAILTHSAIDTQLSFWSPLGYIIGALIAVSAAAASLYFRRDFHSPATLERLMSCPLTSTELAKDAFDHVNLRDLRTLNSLTSEELSLIRLREPYRRSLMLQMAMDELIAVLGLLVALASGMALAVLPFVGGALVMLALAWPKFEDEMERARDLVLTSEAPIQNAS